MTAIWKTLGLKRTTDIAEIRRAYARRLKETDVDGDPEAFIALREALERALNQAHIAQYRAEIADRSDLGDDAGAGADLDFEIRPAVPRDAVGIPLDDRLAVSSISPTEPGDTPPDAEANRRFTELDRLLFADPETWPDPNALIAAVREILDHPEMENVDHHASVGLWLAQALAESIPRSDPAIPMTVDHFGWNVVGRHWDQPWQVVDVTERARALRAVERFSSFSSPHYDAWRELSSDKTELGISRFWMRGKVRRLIKTIRTEYPEVENMLSPYRVQLWERGEVPTPGHATGGGIRWAMIAVWVLFLAAKFFSAATSDDPSRASLVPTAPVYSTAELDISPLLDETAGISFATLGTANPTLHHRLEQQWERARDDGTARDLFFDSVGSAIDEAWRQSVRGGDVELQSIYWRLRRDELNWVRNEPGLGASVCDHMVRGGRPPVFPEDLQTREKELVATALLDARERAIPHDSSGRFMVPGRLFEEARHRAHLDQQAMSDALRERGTETQRCAARIALIEAALALPVGEKARFLREMSKGI